MTSLRWSDVQGFPPRGAVIDASSDAISVNSLASIWQQVWVKITAAIQHYAFAIAPKLVKIVVEVWPDSGRVIFVVSVKRELFRLVVTAAALERAYYALPRPEREFELGYQALYDEIKNQVVIALKTTGLGDISKPTEVGPAVYVQNCGDVETAQPISF